MQYARVCQFPDKCKATASPVRFICAWPHRVRA